MDDDTIYALARSAVWRAMNRLVIFYHEIEIVYDDLVQEAAMAIVVAQRTHPDRAAGYYVGAGAHKVSRWLTCHWWDSHRQTEPLDERTAAPASPSPDHADADLAAVVQTGRRKGGARAAAAIQRDIEIARRRANGWSEAEIAADLGLTKSNVHMALTRMRERHAQSNQDEQGGQACIRSRSTEPT